MAITQITDHVDRAYAMLPEQFKNNTTMRAMLKSWATQIQALENVCFEILNELYLDVAVGVWLDRLGAIVGEERSGADDDVYRLRIRARIQLNKSNGTIPDLLSILQLLIDANTQSFELRESFPAALRVDIRGPATETNAVQLARILRLAKAGGVNAILIASEAEDANTFSWADGDALVAGATDGWGDDVDLSIGGVWAGGF